MTKQIRPLTAFKKQNPEYFNIVNNLANTTSATKSKKGMENHLYFCYAGIEMGLKRGDRFFVNNDNFTNKTTISEIGRFLLTGWYYNIESFTKEVSIYIYNSFYKKVNAGEKFNDMEFAEVVKHIRINISYYFDNVNACKYKILQALHLNELKKALPEPSKEIKERIKFEEFLKIDKNQKKKGINHWIEKAEEMEAYCFLLKEKLEDLNIDHPTFEEFKTSHYEKIHHT
jgi:hypothetical protein